MSVVSDRKIIIYMYQIPTQQICNKFWGECVCPLFLSLFYPYLRKNYQYFPVLSYRLQSWELGKDSCNLSDIHRWSLSRLGWDGLLVDNATCFANICSVSVHTFYMSLVFFLFLADQSFSFLTLLIESCSLCCCSSLLSVLVSPGLRLAIAFAVPGQAIERDQNATP